jgi:hypothetical protein
LPAFYITTQPVAATALAVQQLLQQTNTIHNTTRVAHTGIETGLEVFQLLDTGRYSKQALCSNVLYQPHPTAAATTNAMMSTSIDNDDERAAMTMHDNDNDVPVALRYVKIFFSTCGRLPGSTRPRASSIGTPKIL